MRSYSRVGCRSEGTWSSHGAPGGSWSKATLSRTSKVGDRQPTSHRGLSVGVPPPHPPHSWVRYAIGDILKHHLPPPFTTLHHPSPPFITLHHHQPPPTTLPPPFHPPSTIPQPHLTPDSADAAISAKFKGAQILKGVRFSKGELIVQVADTMWG